MKKKNNTKSTDFYRKENEKYKISVEKVPVFFTTRIHIWYRYLLPYKDSYSIPSPNSYLSSERILLQRVGFGSLAGPFSEVNISNLHKRFAIELGTDCKLIAEHVKSTVNKGKTAWFLLKIFFLLSPLSGPFSFFLKNQCLFL